MTHDIRHLEFDKLPGMPAVFHSFLSGSDFMKSRFPTDAHSPSTGEYFRAKAESFAGRPELITAVKASVKGELSRAEQAELDLLAEPNTLACVTGQQVGFTGGPLYTVYKIASAIKNSRELKKIHPELNFVPVFWVEDNDHDAREAVTAYIFDKSGKVVSAESPVGEEPGTPVSELTFADGIDDAIDEIVSILPDKEFSGETRELLADIYRPGRNVADAFISLIRKIFSDFGVLTIKASELRKAGLFDELALVELKASIEGRSSDYYARRAGELLKSEGLALQARSSVPALFAHTGSKRIKVKFEDGQFAIGDSKYSAGEIEELLRANKGMFSPAVLTRPVFQDAVCPTATYSAGPGEIGYSAQIKEIYDMFGAGQPAMTPRLFATLIDKKSARTFEKYSLDPEFFLRPSQTIEKELTDEIISQSELGFFADAKSEISAIFEMIGQNVESIDKGLTAAVKSAQTAAIQQIDNVERKTKSSVKKSAETKTNALLAVSTFLYPENSLQERILTPISILPTVGLDGLKEIIASLIDCDYGTHHLIYL